MLPPLPTPAISLTRDSVLSALPQGPLGTVAFLAAWLVVSYGVVWVFNKVLLVHARKSRSKFDDVIAEAIRLPLYVWLVLLGLWALTHWFDVLPAAWVPGTTIAIALLLALSAAWTVVSIALGAMAEYSARRPSFRTVQGAAEFGVRMVVYSVALLLVLDYLGITITPLLGALGIGGLAVALALQETLANFFAGMYLNLDRPLREGDFVELEGGAIKGYVVDISWRSTRIRELPNNVYVVPNSKVASGIIKNYDLPESQMAVLVDVSVAYGSDLERVEKVTVEVAKEVQGRVAGAVPSHAPFIRYHTFADSGINFTVILRAMTFVDQFLLKHEFVKALHARYLEEGIEIPFPQRTVHLKAVDGSPAVSVPHSAPGPPRPSR